MGYSDTKGIRKRMVAIISVMLILVTTISFSAPAVLAEDPADAQPAAETQTQPAAEAEGQPAEGGDAEQAADPAAQPAADPAAGQGQDAGAGAETKPEDAAGTEAAPEAAEENKKEQKTETEPDKTGLPAVSSSSYIVMSGSTSEKVVTHHAERKMQPGRITVLMTAMVVLDNMYNDEELSNTVDITEKLAKYGDSFRQGESISVGDLLTAMLVGGDAQAAEALASYSASKRSIFINEMNSKCMALGIMDTQFENPSGEYKTTQYSTAADLAVITQAAMRYRKVKDAFAKESAAISVFSKEGVREIEYKGTNLLLTGSADQKYKYTKGGIMGSLGAPANSSQYAAVATKDDMQLIVILMDSGAETIAAEAKGLLEYGDTKVTKNTIVKKGKRSGYARIRGGASTRVAAYTESKGFAYVPPEGSESLVQTQVVMLNDLEAPMKAGDKVGEYRIFVADELKGTVDLVIKKDVPEGWPPSKLYISNAATVVLSVILVMIAALFARIEYVKRQRALRREALRRQKIREMALEQMRIDEDRRRRNWNGRGYAPMELRTTDIRREAVSGAADKNGPGNKKGKGRRK